MSRPIPAEPEVFTVSEIARAAGVSPADVRAALDVLEPVCVANKYFPIVEAVRIVRRLHKAGDQLRPSGLFAPLPASERRGGVPLAASGALHLGLLVAMVLISGLGLRSEPTEQRIQDPVRLVFLVTPGPGGGGGGGGLRQPLRPPRAELKGRSALKSPVTVTKKVERREPEKRTETPPPPPPVSEPKPEPVPPPPPAPAPTPPVVAPVVTAPSDNADRAGTVTDPPAATASNGPGTGGGTGTGRGTGSGEGDGAGIGDGSTAGIGGGPYRPGSGITPPTLEREVKPIYSEEGRRRGVEGDVVLEVVIRSNGTVGAVRVVKSLGAGLDQRAIDAVRQWRFSPARRFGTPVDVLVEIAVGFKIR